MGSSTASGSSVGARRDLAAQAEALYEQHRGRVYHLALRYGAGNSAWAEDVTQDVFLVALRKLESLSDLDDLGGWFYRVTTNRCLKKLRRERMIDATPVGWLMRQRSREPSPEALVEARAELRHAFRLLGTMPPKVRVAFSMYHLDGRTQPEIGAILGHTKGYVSKLISRAEAQLRAAGWEVS